MSQSGQYVVICQLIALLEVLGRLHVEVMPKLALRDEGRIEKSRRDRGLRSGFVGTRTESL